MKVNSLIHRWERASGAPHTRHAYAVRLPIHDAARIAALAEIYPNRTETEIITDLLSAALDELEEALPYVPGSRTVAEDEFGDPLYEDVGPTPRFETLTRKHQERLGSAAGDAQETATGGSGLQPTGN
ncbi:MAG: type 1 pili tip component [Chromatiales bacterium 21-64-14]|nr:MAG: type 1 pili tip component [Chromatiales bacterium 21-64-14]HQU15426.1 type 1 pili tip component [Gammaproteobacteria bacterium]